MTLNGYFTLNSVLAPVGLDIFAWLSKTIAQEQIQRDSCLWQYTAYSDIGSDSVEGKRQWGRALAHAAVVRTLAWKATLPYIAVRCRTSPHMQIICKYSVNMAENSTT